MSYDARGLDEHGHTAWYNRRLTEIDADYSARLQTSREKERGTIIAEMNRFANEQVEIWNERQHQLTAAHKDLLKYLFDMGITGI
jgi:hypothetical protein